MAAFRSWPAGAAVPPSGGDAEVVYQDEASIRVLPQQDVSRHFALIADQDQRVVDAAFTHPLHGPQGLQLGGGEGFGQIGLIDLLQFFRGQDS